MSEAVNSLSSNKSFPTLFSLALRLLWRDWQGGEIRLLFIALVMAVTSVTGIALFTDRLEKALLLESANMLAADRVLGSGRQPPEEILVEAESLGLRTARTLSFTSMAFSDTGNMLVAAKAVSDTYPLRGEVIIADQPFISWSSYCQWAAPRRSLARIQSPACSGDRRRRLRVRRRGRTHCEQDHHCGTGSTTGRHDG